MAIGLVMMIGIQWSMNFHSLYKARNIADFWRRWHVTLSRFLRDCLSIPLGGNQRGLARQPVNPMLTMLLGGLWHDAGWAFVIWGGLHGLYLTVFRAWRCLVARRARRLPAAWLPIARGLSWPLTFLLVVVAWVFLSAESFATAMSILQSMSGVNGAVVPPQVLKLIQALGQVATGVGKVPYLADGTVMGLVEMVLMIAGGLFIVVLAPTLSELRL